MTLGISSGPSLSSTKNPTAIQRSSASGSLHFFHHTVVRPPTGGCFSGSDTSPTTVGHSGPSTAIPGPPKSSLTSSSDMNAMISLNVASLNGASLTTVGND